jgi:hypothetical protein
MASDRFPPPILVLAGPGVPGATLAAALGRNPAAFGLPALNLELEPMLDNWFATLSGLRAGQTHGLLRTLALVLGGEQSILAVAMARRWLMRRMHLPTAHVSHEIAALLAPRRMVLPVTAGLFYPAARERLAETWPGADVLQLRLHPLHHAGLLLADSGGAAALLLGAAETAPGMAPAPDPETLWMMTEDALAAFAADWPGPGVRTLRLEDLLAAPAEDLARLAAGLGLPADAAAVAAMCRPESAPLAGPGPFGAHAAPGIRSFADLRQALAAARGPGGLTGLTVPLPWRADARSFRPELRDRARALGYA